MLKTLTLLCIGVPILSGCLTIDPISFTSEHPANAQTVDHSEKAVVSAIRDYTTRKPHHPLDEKDRAAGEMNQENMKDMPGMDHGSMKNMPGMDHGNREAAPTLTESAPPEASQMYTCPMHPQVVQDHEGRCPICEMRLVPQKKAGASDTQGEKQ